MQISEQYRQARRLGDNFVLRNYLYIMGLTAPLRRASRPGAAPLQVCPLTIRTLQLQICSGGDLSFDDLTSPWRAAIEEGRSMEPGAPLEAYLEVEGAGGRDAPVIPEARADECPICLDEVDRPTKTECGHWFCESQWPPDPLGRPSVLTRQVFTPAGQECIQGTLRLHPRNGCPTCRAPLTLDQLILGRARDAPVPLDPNKRMTAWRHPHGVSLLPRTPLAAVSKLQVLVRELGEMRRRDPGAKALIFSQYAR